MPTFLPKISPLGDSALVIEFGREISVDLNERSIALANYLDAHAFDGYIEAVPAYSSTAIFYDASRVRKQFPDSISAFDTVKSIVEKSISRLNQTVKIEGRAIDIPVSFDEGDAPDLAFVADQAGMNYSEVIDLFVSTQYRVFMVGFLPGFAYMGKVDPRLTVPRKETPRIKVPKGSVGIAARQTGIYPFESPGGWQIIGRTNVEMFMPDGDPPCYLRPGDQVRFVQQ